VPHTVQLRSGALSLNALMLNRLAQDGVQNFPRPFTG
jgi:hypothetical protein